MGSRPFWLARNGRGAMINCRRPAQRRRVVAVWTTGFRMRGPGGVDDQVVLSTVSVPALRLVT